MYRSIRGIVLRTSDDGDCIEIYQEGRDPEDRDNTIEVTLDQIDILVRWLNDAKAELLSHQPVED